MPFTCPITVTVNRLITKLTAKAHLQNKQTAANSNISDDYGM